MDSRTNDVGMEQEGLAALITQKSVGATPTPATSLTTEASDSLPGASTFLLGLTDGELSVATTCRTCGGDGSYEDYQRPIGRFVLESSVERPCEPCRGTGTEILLGDDAGDAIADRLSALVKAGDMDAAGDLGRQAAHFYIQEADERERRYAARPWVCACGNRYDVPPVGFKCHLCGAPVADERLQDEPWTRPNAYGERPGDLCCVRATGDFCYEHDPANFTGVH